MERHRRNTKPDKRTRERIRKMATSKEYKEFIVEQLSYLNEITIRPMMGEYLLYYQGKLFGGIYDNRLLIKITEIGKKLMENPKEEIPYQGAKPMLLVEELENQEDLKKLIISTCEELPDKKAK